MTPSYSVRICTREELCGQPGLSPKSQFIVRPSEFHSPCGRDRFIILNLHHGGEALLPAAIKDNGVATLGPLIHPPGLTTEERRRMWQAGIDWARTEHSTAFQLFCDQNAKDAAILGDLGFPVTTEIVTLTWDSCDLTVPHDETIRPASFELEQPALSNLAARTLVDSLDFPESIPLHRPQDLLLEWVGGSDEAASESLILVAESQGEMVGLLVARLTNQGRAEPVSCHINYFGVAPEHRRQGWGTRLLNQFLQLASRARVEAVSVFTDQRNLPAIQLYQQAGFRVDDLRLPIVFHRIM